VLERLRGAGRARGVGVGERAGEVHPRGLEVPDHAHLADGAEERDLGRGHVDGVGRAEVPGEGHGRALGLGEIEHPLRDRALELAEAEAVEGAAHPRLVAAERGV
jgi:hypothetical protein